MKNLFTREFWRTLPSVLWRENRVASICIILAALVCLSRGFIHDWLPEIKPVRLLLIVVLGYGLSVFVRSYRRISDSKSGLSHKMSKPFGFLLYAIFVFESAYILVAEGVTFESLAISLPVILILGISVVSHMKDDNAMAIPRHIAGSVASLFMAISVIIVAGFAVAVVFGMLYAPLQLLTDVEFPQLFFHSLIMSVAFVVGMIVFLWRDAFVVGNGFDAVYTRWWHPFVKMLTIILIYVIMVMYLYMLIILFRFELPRGYISTVASCCTLLGLVTYIACDCEWLSEHGKFWQKMHRIIPWLMLPLQVLMTVALTRRISEYGMTISRAYGLVLNLWFYGVCLYLIVSRKKQIKWLPISFVLTLFIAVSSPFNVREYVKWQLLDDIENNRGKVQDKKDYLRENYSECIYLDSCIVGNSCAEQRRPLFNR